VNVDYPFHFDNAGRTATSGVEDHVRDMIELILLTSPGERVMMPDFGSGLLLMTFEPNSAELASALEFTLQASLQRWLGDVIETRKVSVEARDSMLLVVVEYALRRTGEVLAATVERKVS
jgi:hypothetical protein